MDLIVVVILGAVQGITEFLPVSSSGHLVLLENIFGVEQSSLFLNVILHCATLLAVLFFYRKKLWQLLKKPFQPLTYYLLISTAITCGITLLFADFFEQSFSGALLAWGFLLSAVFLFVTEIVSASFERKGAIYKKVGYKQSALLGLFQGFALLPGISRSGTTLCAGIVMGLEKKEALDYSFLMSIPIIVASMVYELVRADMSAVFSEVNILQLVIGGAVAFLFAIAGIKLMLKVVEKVQYRWFALYLLILAVVTIFLI